MSSVRHTQSHIPRRLAASAAEAATGRNLKFGRRKLWLAVTRTTLFDATVCAHVHLQPLLLFICTAGFDPSIDPLLPPPTDSSVCLVMQSISWEFLLGFCGIHGGYGPYIWLIFFLEELCSKDTGHIYGWFFFWRNCVQIEIFRVRLRCKSNENVTALNSSFFMAGPAHNGRTNVCYGETFAWRTNRTEPFFLYMWHCG
jgi:hypothetical protein